MSRRLLGIMPGQRDKGARLGTFVRDIPGKHILSPSGQSLQVRSRPLVHRCPLSIQYRPQILSFGICRDVPTTTSLAYSMTSLARSRIEVGNSMPRAFAVLRLTASSNLVGNSIGRSAGLAPRRILAT